MLWTRNYPVVLAGGLAVLLFSLVGAAAITGALPGSDRDAKERLPSPERIANSPVLKRAPCADCALVADIRPIGMRPVGYRVVLRMDDGSERIVSQTAEPAFGVGARVRVHGDGARGAVLARLPAGG